MIDRKRHHKPDGKHMIERPKATNESSKSAQDAPKMHRDYLNNEQQFYHLAQHRFVDVLGMHENNYNDQDQFSHKIYTRRKAPVQSQQDKIMILAKFSPYSQPTILSQIQNHRNKLLRPQRAKRRSMGPQRIKSPLLTVFMWLSALALICDIHQNQIVSLAIEDESTSPVDSALGQQRFVEEPKDVYVQLGRSASLSCAIENKIGNLTWVRNDYAFGTEGIYGTFASLFRQTVQLGDSSAAGSPPLNSTSDQISASPTGRNIANYTLHLDNVTFVHEASYKCSVGDPEAGLPMVSRATKLTVLLPPTRLEISATDSSDSRDILLPHDETEGEQIRVVKVRQNSRLRLECRTDAAKPYAELVWLNNEMKKIPKSSGRDDDLNDNEDDSNDNDNLLSNNSSSSLDYTRENISLDGKDSRLAITTLIWSFKVQRQHQNQLLTCQAQHPALESTNNGEQLRRQIRLDVQYAPDVNLTKDQTYLHENKPVKFSCSARGQPNQLTYSWFIDDQLILNATDSELYIEQVTRQLHLRQLKCRATNSIGSNTSSMQLNVKYAPAFVSHLLPASELNPVSRPSSGRARFVVQPSDEQTLARQLAIGFNEGDSIKLRCDFDSNPRQTQIDWFKIDTKWPLLSNVTPTLADEFISSGWSGAIFLRETLTPIAIQRPSTQRNSHSKRHISSSIAPPLVTLDEFQGLPYYPGGVHSGSDGSLFASALDYNQAALDYEQLSNRLLAELAELRAADQTSGGSDSQPLVERIPALPPTHPAEPVAIHEPLSWRLIQLPIFNNQEAFGVNSNNNNKRQLHHNRYRTQLHKMKHQVGDQQVSATISEVMTPTVADSAAYLAPTLILQKPLTGGNSSSGQLVAPLNSRTAALTSSFIKINSAKEADAGKYICQTRPINEGQMAENFAPVAHAIHLVLRNRPRLVSVQEQFASLGASTMQIECLAQINTELDNRTVINWSRGGKSIDVIQKVLHLQNKMKNFTTFVEISPDFLFMRSKLLIQGADQQDFGKYTCTIARDGIQFDFIDIALKESISPGFPFALMMAFLIGAIIVVTCLIAGLILAYGPRSQASQRLEAKLRASDQVIFSASSMSGSPAIKSQHTDLTDGHDSDRKSPRSSDSGHEEGSLSDLQQLQQQQQQQQHQHQLQTLQGVYDNQANMVAQQMSYSAPDSNSLNIAYSSTYANNNSDQTLHPHHKLRSSLRQPAGSAHNPNSRSGKFAAIHESLEHKLQLTPSEVLKRSAVNTNLTNINDCSLDKCQTVSELDDQDPKSLLDRLLSRIRKRQQPTVVNGSVKSRPVISMPLAGSMNRAGLNLKRSSLSTSLSTLDNQTGTVNQNMVTMNHVNGTGSHLLSSSANLIQDSTASDGTASSGRSSSSSSGNQPGNRQTRTHHHHPQQQQLPNSNQDQQQQHLINNYDTVNQASYMQRTMWMQPPPTMNGDLHYPTVDYYANCNGVVVSHPGYQQDNSSASSTTHMNLAYNPQASYVSSSIVDPSQVQQHIGYPTHPLTTTWIDGHQQQQQQQHVGGPEHYQLPSISSAMIDANGSCYTSSNVMTAAVASANNQQHPCYATIATSKANGVSTSMANYAQVNGQQQQCHQMVPTSNVDEAYFESTYGTMLSQSSAYRTLGYATSGNVYNHSNSSSPNSMITHANNSSTTTMTMTGQVDNQDQLLPQKLAIVQQPDGSTNAKASVVAGAKKKLDKNGLATHV